MSRGKDRPLARHVDGDAEQCPADAIHAYTWVMQIILWQLRRKSRNLHLLLQQPGSEPGQKLLSICLPDCFSC